MPNREREHGAASYNKGCRCNLCRDASNQRFRRLRQARIAALPTAEQCVICDAWCNGYRGLVGHEVRAHRQATA